MSLVAGFKQGRQAGAGVSVYIFIYKVCSKFGVLVVAIKGISNFGIKREEYLKYKEYARQKANLVLERILDREEQK